MGAQVLTAGSLSKPSSNWCQEADARPGRKGMCILNQAQREEAYNEEKPMSYEAAVNGRP